MKLTAEQAFISIEFQLNLVSDPTERKKLETMILGAVESFETTKSRIAQRLDKYERYKIKPKTKTLK